MLGPLANSAALILGGLGGAVLGRRLPRRVRETLPLTFGIIAAAIGTTLMNKVHALPAVALALILGSLAGELAHLERGLEKAIGWAQRQAERLMPGEKGNPRVEGFVGKFVTLLVLFCASGMGIFGATQEGMTGDAHILLAKSILDLFTALIFAAELGPAVALICLPQAFGAGRPLPRRRPAGAPGDAGDAGRLLRLRRRHHDGHGPAHLRHQVLPHREHAAGPVPGHALLPAVGPLLRLSPGPRCG